MDIKYAKIKKYAGFKSFYDSGILYEKNLFSS